MDELIEDIATAIADNPVNWQDYVPAARAALAAIHARGDRIVPGVATGEMVEAVRDASVWVRVAHVYTAMLSASPYSPEETK